MNFQIFRQILKYPRKRIGLKYLLQNPSLTFAISQNPSKFYFSKTLEGILDSNIVSCLHNSLPERLLNHLKKRGFGDHDGIRLLLYLIVRKYQPEIVVETGVSWGASSAFILCAMHENSKGHLYSIDLPPYEASVRIKDGNVHVLEDSQRHCVNEEYSVGALVPEYLKERWTLIVGDARKELPVLLKKVNKVSIFLHDSLHTYEHMMFEYETAWPYITKGGLLLSHDVLWNSAFLRFSKKENSKPLIYYSLGAIKKR